MSARIGALAALALSSCTPVPRPLALPAGTPAAVYLARCSGHDGWDDPAPPLRIYGNVYDVGTCGITALLIVSDDGHVLIDGGTAKGGALVAANVAALGLDIKGVRWIVGSHEHFDHAGGIAELVRLSGAKVAALPPYAAVLSSGQPDPADPQIALLRTMPLARVRIDRVLRDGETLVLGKLRLTAHATFGHAQGSTSWTWRACESGVCKAMVYADSVNSISGAGYRFSAHPEWVARFRASLDRIASLPCDILLTPHPAASDMAARIGGSQPLADPSACRRYAEAGRERLDARLARETAGTEP